MNEPNQNGGELELSREVEAIQIPSGDNFKLPAGTKVIITQSLGGTYTVATDQGLARISDKDSDALGIKEEKVDQPATEKVNSGIDVKDEDFESAVWEQLKTVFGSGLQTNVYDFYRQNICIVTSFMTFENRNYTLWLFKMRAKI